MFSFLEKKPKKAFHSSNYPPTQSYETIFPGKKSLASTKHTISSFSSLFSALKTNWSHVFKSPSIAQDLIAAVTVAAVALPLNIALAIACDLPPYAGLIAGAVGGALAALFGGSILQVTGPAAALNVMVLAMTKDFGPMGVAIGCVIIGSLQIGLSFLSTGRFIRWVPDAVLAGFTSGVGLKILDQQIPEWLGFNYTVFELAEMFHRPMWLHQISWYAVICGLFVAMIVISLRPFKKFPAALLGIVMITYVSHVLNWDIARVGDFSASIQWVDFSALADEKWFELFIAAVPLGILASVESLLSAGAVDRLSQAKTPHHSDLELFGQGIANLGSGIVCGMPVSGVVVRSSVNVHSGGKTRLAAFFHAMLLLFSMFYLSQTLSIIPLSALAGLLCVIGMRLIEFESLSHLWKKSKPEALCFMISLAGTVSGHLMGGLAGSLLVYSFYLWLTKKQQFEKASHSKPRPSAEGIRAIIDKKEKEGPRKPDHYKIPMDEPNWLLQIQEKAHLAASAFVHQKASVIGRVILGEQVHIAAESSVRADEGSPFFIGSYSNIQDGVVVHALKEKWVHVAGEDWAVYIGQNVSVAHQALIHGPCYIGDHSFVGFQAVVHDSVLGSNCYVGIGAIIVGVEIPSGKYIPHGSVIDNLEKVEQLPNISDAHRHFNEDVVGVNKGLVAAYKKQQGKIDFTQKHRLNLTQTWRKETYGSF